jgi:hypothetical protein
MDFISILSFALAAPQMAATPAADPIEAAFRASLSLDEAAYYQICSHKSRQARFDQLSRRADALEKRYSDRVLKGQIFISYVDRRAKDKCFAGERFDATIGQWSMALDRIETMIEERH